MTYTLVRTKRKTAAIYIKNGGIEVRAPLHMPRPAIDSFVAAHAQWLSPRLDKSRAEAARRAAFALGYESTVLYRGQGYPLISANVKRGALEGAAFHMPPNLPPPALKAACIALYRRLAKRDLTAITFDLARKMGVTPSGVKITGAKTRWGSCSSQKNINYSWRLMMAADDVIEYVVVHELAHLMQMNHSARFWAIVQGILPDYKQRRLKLHALQAKLANEDWDE